jgi:hypothetical protein
MPPGRSVNGRPPQMLAPVAPVTPARVGPPPSAHPNDPALSSWPGRQLCPSAVAPSHDGELPSAPLSLPGSARAPAAVPDLLGDLLDLGEPAAPAPAPALAPAAAGAPALSVMDLLGEKQKRQPPCYATGHALLCASAAAGRAPQHRGTALPSVRRLLASCSQAAWTLAPVRRLGPPLRGWPPLQHCPTHYSAAPRHQQRRQLSPRVYLFCCRRTRGCSSGALWSDRQEAPCSRCGGRERMSRPASAELAGGCHRSWHAECAAAAPARGVERALPALPPS